MSVKQWVELCEASGIDTTRMSPLEVYLASGKLINDEVLTKRAREICPGPILHTGARLQAIQEMTANERAELRERVSGVVPFARKESSNKNRGEQIARETAKEQALEPDEENESSSQ